MVAESVDLLRIARCADPVVAWMSKQGERRSEGVAGMVEAGCDARRRRRCLLDLRDARCHALRYPARSTRPSPRNAPQARRCFHAAVGPSVRARAAARRSVATRPPPLHWMGCGSRMSTHRPTAGRQIGSSPCAPPVGPPHSPTTRVGPARRCRYARMCTRVRMGWRHRRRKMYAEHRGRRARRPPPRASRRRTERTGRPREAMARGVRRHGWRRASRCLRHRVPRCLRYCQRYCQMEMCC